MSDIVHRTLEKDDKLATLREHRDHVNACKSLERKLDLDLKREKACNPSLCICVHHRFPFSLLSVAGVVHCNPLPNRCRGLCKTPIPLVA